MNRNMKYVCMYVHARLLKPYLDVIAVADNSYNQGLQVFLKAHQGVS